MSALAQLLAPFPIDRFMEAHLPGRWCVIDGPIERLPSWLQAPALNDLAVLGRSFRGTGYVNRSVHCHPTEVHYGSDDAKPEVLHAMGMTQTFPNVQRFVPECDAGLAELCGAMGVSRGMFEAHLFVSPRGEGLRWHFDPCDTFVIQLRGSKRWSVAANHHVLCPVGTPVVPGMRPSLQHLAQMPDALPASDPTEAEHFELTAGSVLFLPRGLWHRTDASDDTSISVSVSSKVPTIGDCVLRQLEALLLQDPAMRRLAYGLAGDASQRGAFQHELDRCVARLPALVHAVSAACVTEREATGDALVAALTLDTRFYRDPSTRVTLARTSEPDPSLRVTTDVSALMLSARRGDAGAFECSPEAEPLVVWVDGRRDTFAGRTLAEAFDDVDADSVMALLGSMLDVGMVGVVPFPRVEIDSAAGAVPHRQ